MPKKLKNKKTLLSSPVSYHIIITLVIIAVYSQSIGFDFVHCDDYDIIVRDYNRISKIGNMPGELFKGYMATDYYRPLQYFLFILEGQIGGMKPAIYHITNILLHILFSISLFTFLIRLSRSARLGKSEFALSFFLTLLFAIHPLNTNAVAWIVGRNDILFGLFVMLSLISLDKYLSFKTSDFFKKTDVYLALHILLFFLSLLAKETAIVAPFIFAAYILFNNSVILNEAKQSEEFESKIKAGFFASLRMTVSKRNLFLLAFWVFALGSYFLLRANAELGTTAYRTGFDIFIYNLAMVPEYFAKFFLPVILSSLPTYNLFNTIVGIAFILIFILIILFKLRKKKEIQSYTKTESLFILGLAWFIIFTFPGLFHQLLNAHDWNEYLECRAYLPIVGLLLMCRGLLNTPNEVRSSKKKKSSIFNLQSSIAVIVIIVFGILTFLESSNYKNPIAFYESAVKKSPDRAMMHFLLARFYSQEGITSLAESEMIASVNANPNHAKYHNNLGVFYFKSNRFADAGEQFSETIRLDSGYRTAYNSLGRAYYDLGKLPQAIDIWQMALSRWSYEYDAAYNLVLVYIAAGDLEGASYYKQYLLVRNKKKDELKALYNLSGVDAFHRDKIRLAARLWNESIAIDSLYLEPYYNLYYIYKDILKSELAERYKSEILKRGGKIIGD